MKKFPKIMPAPTSKSGFTGMTPEDDKLLRYVDDVKRGDTKKYEKAEEKLFEPMLDRLKKDPIKKFNSYDKSSFPSDPNQRRKLDTWEILQQDAKDEAKRGNYKPMRELKKIERDAMPKKKKPIPLANNFNIDVSGLSKQFNNYIAIKELQNKPLPTPPKPQPKKSGGGLEDLIQTDEFYLRMKGI